MSDSLPEKAFPESLYRPLTDRDEIKGQSQVEIIPGHPVTADVYWGRIDKNSFNGAGVSYGFTKNEQGQDVYATFVEKTNKDH